MKIHEISVRRPIAVFMCVLIVLVLGGVSFARLPIDLLPDIDFPMAIISTNYSGVGPQEIENIVTKPMENAVATVANIKTIQSQSTTGNSLIIAEFNSGTDMDFATLRIRERVDMFKGLLPSEVENPVVIKMDPSMIPITVLGVTGYEDDVALKQLVEDKIKPRLERLDGVASITVTGGKTREIQINADPQKMAGYGISTNNIISALPMENTNQPGGTVEYGDKSLLVRTTGEFKTIDDIKNIPIVTPGGSVVYIRDIALVEDSYKTVDSYSRTNGKNSIGMTIQKQSKTNTVKVVKAVKEEIKDILADYPGVKIDMVFDQSEYIEKSVNNVVSNAIMGGFLAVLVLYIFLKNIRTTLIIGTAIPISIISTFVLVYFSGITLNLISLGGLALGVGMLVDNAIVVLENIYRYRDEGHSKVEAAIMATQEVGTAIIASTLTTVVVFLPIVFTEGMTAEIFKQMALTVCFSLMASLIVALTLIPMLSSKFLRIVKAHQSNGEKPSNKILDKWDDILNSIDANYERVLKWVLSHRRRTVIIAASVFILSLVMLPFIGAEFFPTMDQGQFTVDIELAQGALLQNTDEITKKVEGIMSNIPEIEKLFITVGKTGGGGEMGGSASNISSISVTLKPLKERRRSTAEVVDWLRNQTSGIAGADIKVKEASSGMFGSGGSPVSIQINGPDFDKLRMISEKVEVIVKSVEGTRQVESSISKGRPEAQIIVNREKASYYGLGTSQVAAAVRAAVEGKVATSFKVGGDEIDVRVQLPEETRKTYEQLKSVKIASNGGEIPLSDIAELKIEEGPTTVTREAQQRYATVNADIFGRNIGMINKDIKVKMKNLALPNGYTINFEGQEKEIGEAFRNLSLALLLSILLVYMIMAAQFESLLHPFTIMFSVPLAYSGAALGLFITRKPLSVPAFIGIIMLAGIVVNNAIVLVDYINTLRSRGMERYDAIIKAGPTRLRPILMTTMTTILGLLPLALGIGEGAESQAPLAIVVIFGLSASTMLTLVVVPVVYTLFDDILVKIQNKRKLKKQKAAAV